MKDVNRVQLAVYYAIGKYLSKNTRRLAYGAGGIKAISDQLRKEMPGLRGFSATQLKDMRRFYEAWKMLDSNKCQEAEIQDDDTNRETTVTTVKSNESNSTVVTVELQNAENQIDIYHAITIPNLTDFPVEDFFRVPFTHHTRIMALCKDTPARYYYIHRTAPEKLSVDALEKLIKQQAYEHQEQIPNNFLNTMSNSSMALKAVTMFKDSYALSFVNTEEIGERDKEDIDEIVMEQKMGDFKTSYLAQLSTYLRILDDHVKKPHENPSLGIVLCKNADKDFVEYVIQDYKKPMGVATYKTAEDMPERLRKALPNVEDLKKLIIEDEKKMNKGSW